MAEDALVHIVDDDTDVLHSIEVLLGSVGIRVRTYPTAAHFLREYRAAPGIPACLLLDVRMPGLSGMGLLERLHAEGIDLPVIMLTGHGDIPMSVRAMKLGAVDFLTKPFNHQRLLDLIQQVLRDPVPSANLNLSDAELCAARERWETLTPREREVFEHIVSGKANKVVAFELGISIRTVETHRARIMGKLQARTLIDLVILWINLDRNSNAC